MLFKKLKSLIFVSFALVPSLNVFACDKIKISISKHTSDSVLLCIIKHDHDEGKLLWPGLVNTPDFNQMSKLLRSTNTEISETPMVNKILCLSKELANLEYGFDAITRCGIINPYDLEDKDYYTMIEEKVSTLSKILSNILKIERIDFIM